jgi:hypothetical protein
MTMNDELERNWRNKYRLIEALSQHLPGGTKENP